MKWSALLGLAFLTFVAVAVEGQPRRPVRTERFQIRIEAAGNELLAQRNALVIYATIERLTRAIEQQALPHSVPFRLVRASPPQTIDYLLGVTSEGTLVVGQQVYTFDLPEDRYLFTRGDIARSYPPLDRAAPWMWLVEVPLSREVNVTLELRAATPWPVRSVTITPSPAP